VVAIVTFVGIAWACMIAFVVVRDNVRRRRGPRLVTEGLTIAENLAVAARSVSDAMPAMAPTSSENG
jgi:hypothetical protein